ncbi:MAG: cyclic pyranopterin monophosphate synthase MoaC [bacterium]|nr:cyclic pyranopterin monophosphate synthase MoaC [bacterium]
MAKLTHISEDGSVQMVDVTGKEITAREAVAGGEILMRPETVQQIAAGSLPKGNVLETARIAGIQAAKRTSDLIPLCHPIAVTGVDLVFEVGQDRILAEARVRVPDRTGVEMEALAAVSVALLTVYDMCKAVDKNMVIGNVRLLKKTGGRSGTYVRKP